MWSRRKVVCALFQREIKAYFYSPIAYVFASIFVLAVSSATIFLGGLFRSDSASFDLLFTFLPWVFLFLVPAVGMRLWSEEKSSGSIELLLTLPIKISEAVIAKFLAGWAFLGFCLLLTIPYPITIFILGSPDIGAMLTGYLGCYLLAGTYLAISCFTSAMTRNQVISFIFSFMVCFLLTIVGWGVFNDLLGNLFWPGFASFIASFGILPHFDSLQKGIVDLGDLLYFVLLIAGALAMNIKLIEEGRVK